MSDYPDWICMPCGHKYGRRLPDLATWHWDTCGVCGEQTQCTEPRDFGHLNSDLKKQHKTQKQ